MTVKTLRFLLLAFASASFVATAALAAPPANTADAEKPSFTRDIAPILQRSCETCHRPGQIAPMSLRTYDEVRPWAKSIQKVTAKRTMPPWHADPQFGSWKNDISLSDSEIDTISRWVDQGAPRGDLSDMPAARDWGPQEWRLGEPDVTFTYSRPAPVGKEVDDEYRCFVMSVPFEEEVWLKATDYKPGNPEIVHHYIVFLDKSGRAMELDRRTPEPGFECGMTGGGAELGLLPMIGAWAPGNTSGWGPEGVARRIPAGSQIVLQIHFHNATGEDQTDQSSIGWHLAKGSELVEYEPNTHLLSAWQLDIPPGEREVTHAAEWKTSRHITLLGIAPHMHYRGKSMRVWYQPPGAEEETMLFVPNYDFNWQTTYAFEAPMKIPAGSKFRMESVHDNSSGNPHNPDPTRHVKWGEETHNEMSIAFLPHTVDEKRIDVTPVWPPKRFDPKGDGGDPPATQGNATGGK